MAATATAAPSAQPAPFRFTREMYYRLAEEGLFDGVRVELLDGEIIRMSPQSVPHAGTITRFTDRLMASLQGLFTLRVQLPLVLGEDSEPEPDFAVCDLDPDHYLSGHPTGEDVHLVIEVAFTSVDYDRGRKGAAYARAGIPRYWLVNLPGRVLEEYSDPDRARGVYRRVEARVHGDKVELPRGATLDVAEILPSPPASEGPEQP